MPLANPQPPVSLRRAAASFNQPPEPTTARAAVGRTCVLFTHLIFNSLAAAAQL